jgi:hypothetical protein
MKKINIRIPITVCDLQDFKAVAYARDDSEDFIWTFEAEDDDIQVVCHFIKEQDDECRDSQN